MTTNKPDWKERFDSIPQPEKVSDLPYYNQALKSFISQLLQQQREEIYNHLFSELVGLSEDGIRTEYRRGYFEATDDIAKWVKTLST